MSLVQLDRVSKTFGAPGQPKVHAVNDVTLEIASGETVSLIGESGSGKSTLARLALALHQPDSGRINFAGCDLSRQSRRDLRRMRSQMTMVFQEPFESLNPRQRVGTTVAEPLVIHEPRLDRAERSRRVSEALEHVSLPESYADRYPHELSGGQQQRIGIARAIVTRPQFIVLDEPTSSLDLSVRAHILQLLANLRSELGLAYLFVSHDIHTVEYVADRVYVMYLGQVVETGTVAQVFRDPQHPYTQALLSASLSADPQVKRERVRLGGEIPSATNLPSGCFLHGRCPIGSDVCARERVPLSSAGPGHSVACLKAPAISGRLPSPGADGPDAALVAHGEAPSAAALSASASPQPDLSDQGDSR